MTRLEKKQLKEKHQQLITSYLGIELIRDPIILLYFLVVIMGGFFMTSIATIIYYLLKYIEWI